MSIATNKKTTYWPPFLKSTFLFLLVLLSLPHTDKHKHEADKEHSQAEKPTIVSVHPANKQQ